MNMAKVLEIIACISNNHWLTSSQCRDPISNLDIFFDECIQGADLVTSMFFYEEEDPIMHTFLILLWLMTVNNARNI